MKPFYKWCILLGRWPQLFGESISRLKSNQDDIEECHQSFTTFFSQEISLELDKKGDHQESNIVVCYYCLPY
jgi:hypothetical protein